MNNCKNIAEEIIYEDEIWLKVNKISQIKNSKNYYYLSIIIIINILLNL